MNGLALQCFTGGCLQVIVPGAEPVVRVARGAVPVEWAPVRGRARGSIILRAGTPVAVLNLVTFAGLVHQPRVLCHVAHRSASICVCR